MNYVLRRKRKSQKDEVSQNASNRAKALDVLIIKAGITSEANIHLLLYCSISE